MSPPHSPSELSPKQYTPPPSVVKSLQEFHVTSPGSDVRVQVDLCTPENQQRQPDTPGDGSSSIGPLGDTMDTTTPQSSVVRQLELPPATSDVTPENKQPASAAPTIAPQNKDQENMQPAPAAPEAVSENKGLDNNQPTPPAKEVVSENKGPAENNQPTPEVQKIAPENKDQENTASKSEDLERKLQQALVVPATSQPLVEQTSKEPQQAAATEQPQPAPASSVAPPKETQQQQPAESPSQTAEQLKQLAIDKASSASPVASHDKKEMYKDGSYWRHHARLYMPNDVLQFNYCFRVTC